ncbi:MAG TPA: hypothetical protein VK752_25100 [Bryobacteraceae bacterium]|jgi:hypothetical protein|nr:hypothetical protein [Bryobacteraceae bacterium]
MTRDSASGQIGTWQRASLLIGIAGVLVVVAGLFLNREQALRSYLFAYLYWIGMALGSMGILLLHHTVGGKWGMLIRRMCEAGCRTLPYMAILLIPVLLSIPTLYPWARPEAARDANIQAKSAYLNVPFFLIRAVFYFLVWTFYGWRLSKWSAVQDETGDERLVSKMRAVSAPGLVVFTFVTTFAFIDWIMSLEPNWFSTIYGVMFLVGQVLESFAFFIALVIVLSRWSPLKDYVTPQHLHDLGNMMFAFMVLWAYLSFSQFLIIWAGNLPDEIPWYLRRLRGGWGSVALTLVVFHFATPFVLLLMRKTKRHAQRLIKVCVLIILIRVLDVYWVVKPAFYDQQLSIYWLDFVAPLALGGLWLALFFWQLSSRPLVPLQDPRLQGAPRETVAF